MLIVAKQDNENNLYAIWNTATDRFIGVNISYNECIGMLMDWKGYHYEIAKSRVDHPQSFDDIAKHIYCEFELDYAAGETKRIQDAARLIVAHYKANEDFRNAFIASISSALKELPKESYLEDVAKAIAGRIIGDE